MRVYVTPHAVDTFLRRVDRYMDPQAVRELINDALGQPHYLRAATRRDGVQVLKAKCRIERFGWRYEFRVVVAPGELPPESTAEGPTLPAVVTVVDGYVRRIPTAKEPHP